MSRKITFYKDEYYHVFNRGVDKREIFLDKGDIHYFLDSILISNKKSRSISSVDKYARKRAKRQAKTENPIVKVVAFALMPNHFHLLLKEIEEGGISKFMQKLGTSYTMFFNEKYDRDGALFQGRFKATHVSDLTAVSAYINLNHKHHKISPKNKIIKTSYFEYIDPDSVKELFCDREEVRQIVKTSGGVSKYKKDMEHWSDIFLETHERDKDFDL